MTLGNPRPDTAAQAAVSDPLVMYLVVRRERAAPLDALIGAAARAVVGVDRRFRDDPAWRDLTALWRAESYRKVTLRASERDWARLLGGHEAVVAGDDSGEGLVAALPVRPRSTVCRTLRDLQAYTADTSALPRRPIPPTLEPAMLIVPNPHAPMSAGKLLAQVGHAALMAADLPADWAAGRLEATAGRTLGAAELQAWRTAVERWEGAGSPVLPGFVDLLTFRRLAARGDSVLVTDSGLTEVAPGTQTVLAVRPAEGADLADLRRELAL